MFCVITYVPPAGPGHEIPNVIPTLMDNQPEMSWDVFDDWVFDHEWSCRHNYTLTIFYEVLYVILNYFIIF